MAKRKRLSLPTGPVTGEADLKPTTVTRARMPIAEVAGATAGNAALEEVAREMTAAEDEGRVVKKLPLAAIEERHIARDRMVMDEEEMAVLKASIAERGQQTPIEVVRTGPDRYGLISGKRRLEALRQLGMSEVLALVKKPETSQDAYQAMVEENEIRAQLSFFERANIAIVAARNGVYPDARAAVKALFAHAPRPKRSKILAFVTLCEELGPILRFPTAIPEHLGLALVQALNEGPGMKTAIWEALTEAEANTPGEERAALETALRRGAGGKAAKQAPEKLAPGLTLTAKAGRVVLTGPSVDEAFLSDMRDWIAARGAS